MDIFQEYISAVRRCCRLKFFHTLQPLNCISIGFGAPGGLKLGFVPFLVYMCNRGLIMRVIQCKQMNRLSHTMCIHPSPGTFNSERYAMVDITWNDLWKGQGHSFWYQSISYRPFPTVNSNFCFRTQRSQRRAYMKLPSLFLMVPSLTPYNLLFPQNGGSICPQHTRMAISLQRVIRSTTTSCFVLG